MTKTESENIIETERKLCMSKDKREAWEMTIKEYITYGTQSKSKKIRQQYRDGHKHIVENAILTGKPVPEKVLAEYPNLISNEEMTYAPIVKDRILSFIPTEIESDFLIIELSPNRIIKNNRSWDIGGII